MHHPINLVIYFEERDSVQRDNRHEPEHLLAEVPLLRPTSRMASGAAQLQSEVHVSAHPMTVISAFSQTFHFSLSQVFSRSNPHSKGQAMLVWLKIMFSKGLKLGCAK